MINLKTTAYKILAGIFAALLLIILGSAPEPSVPLWMATGFGVPQGSLQVFIVKNYTDYMHNSTAASERCVFDVVAIDNSSIRNVYFSLVAPNGTYVINQQAGAKFNNDWQIYGSPLMTPDRFGQWTCIVYAIQSNYISVSQTEYFNVTSAIPGCTNRTLCTITSPVTLNGSGITYAYHRIESNSTGTIIINYDDAISTADPNVILQAREIELNGSIFMNGTAQAYTLGGATEPSQCLDSAASYRGRTIKFKDADYVILRGNVNGSGSTCATTWDSSNRFRRRCQGAGSLLIDNVASFDATNSRINLDGAGSTSSGLCYYNKTSDCSFGAAMPSGLAGSITSSGKRVNLNLGNVTMNGGWSQAFLCVYAGPNYYKDFSDARAGGLLTVSTNNFTVFGNITTRGGDGYNFTSPYSAACSASQPGGDVTIATNVWNNITAAGSVNIIRGGWAGTSPCATYAQVNASLTVCLTQLDGNSRYYPDKVNTSGACGSFPAPPAFEAPAASQTFTAPTSDIFTNWTRASSTLTTELQYSLNGTTYFNVNMSDAQFALPTYSPANYTFPNHRLLNTTAYKFRARLYNSTSDTYSDWATSNTFNVNYTATTLTQSMSPSTVNISTSSFSFICNYSSGGQPVQQATAKLMLNGTQYNMTYANGVYVLNNSNTTLTAGNLTWYCDMAKADYSSSIGSNQSFIITLFEVSLPPGRTSVRFSCPFPTIGNQTPAGQNARIGIFRVRPYNATGNHSYSLKLEYDWTPAFCDNFGDGWKNQTIIELNTSAYYSFDVNSNSTYTPDNSIGGTSHGTVSGAIWQPNGIYGGAYAFGNNGTNDHYIYLADQNAGNFTPTQSFAIMAWVRKPTTSPYMPIITRSGAGSVMDWSMYGSAGVMTCYGNTSAAASSTLADGETAHFACVFSGNNISLYKNGAFVSNGTDTHGQRNTPTITTFIGHLYGAVPFNGTIDEVRIYNRSLTGSEIENIYQEGVPCDHGYSANWVQIATFETGEDWTGGTANTTYYKEGTQGWFMDSGAPEIYNNSRTNLDLNLYSNITMWAWTNVTLLDWGLRILIGTNSTNYYMYDAPPQAAGWNFYNVPKANFSVGLGSPSWSNINTAYFAIRAGSNPVSQMVIDDVRAVGANGQFYDLANNVTRWTQTSGTWEIQNVSGSKVMKELIRNNTERKLTLNQNISSNAITYATINLNDGSYTGYYIGNFVFYLYSTGSTIAVCNVGGVDKNSTTVGTNPETVQVKVIVQNGVAHGYYKNTTNSDYVLLCDQAYTHDNTFSLYAGGTASQAIIDNVTIRDYPNVDIYARSDKFSLYDNPANWVCRLDDTTSCMILRNISSSNTSAYVWMKMDCNNATAGDYSNLNYIFTEES